MLMRICLAGLMFLSIAYSQEMKINPARAANPVIRGENFSFGLTTPKGYLLATERFVSQGFSAAFVPLNDSNNLPYFTVMTANKKSDGERTLQNLILWELEAQSHQNPPRRFVDTTSLLTSDKKKVIVKRIVDAAGAGAAAYVDDKNVVAVISMWRRPNADFSKTYEVFKKLVQSYHTIAAIEKSAK